MSKRIGIIGAGTAGLHLGLYLRRHGVDVTIFTDRTPEEQRGSRILNTVSHHAVTVERERALDVDHWPVEEYGYTRHQYRVGPEPLRFEGHLRAPSRSVDYRLYLPRLMEDFAERGGGFEFGRLSPDDLPALSARFDLLVVSTGRGPFAEMFGRDPELSPFTAPRRALCAGIFKGVAQQPTRSVTFHISPGAGEMIEIPTWTEGGLATAMVIENHFGSPLEALATTPYADDPKAYVRLMLDLYRQHYPGCFERVDVGEFDLVTGPKDIVQGGVTPVVRRSHTVLDDGTVAIALGDAHATVDPIMGQGANVASHAAWVLGEEIVAREVYDARFVEHVDRRREDRVLSATRWSNFMMETLTAPTPEFQEFLGALSQGGSLTDEFTDDFNRPERAWDHFATPERTEAWMARHAGADAG